MRMNRKKKKNRLHLESLAGKYFRDTAQDYKDDVGL